MEQNTTIQAEPAPVPAPEPVRMELRVAVDQMMAYLRIKAPAKDSVVKPEEILAFLTENQIAYGICTKEIAEFCAQGSFLRDLVCARGLAPIDGKNGEMCGHFEKSHDLVPQEREDGTFDYRNLNLVQTVQKGQLLCSRTLPTEGRDGINVYGNTVEYRRGTLPEFPSGVNTVVSTDSLQLLAGIDGCIKYQGGVVSVEDVYTIRGNVDHETGNIRFPGSVVVTGDICEGFIVDAGKNLNIRGMAEGAKLVAGGDVILSGGMNGMGSGKITAGGNITGKFFQNTRLECGGDVQAEVLMNSVVEAKGSVLLYGGKSVIIGGRCTAGQCICANQLGTSSGVKTKLTISSPEMLERMATGSQDAEIEALTDKKKQLLLQLKNMEAELTNSFKNIRDAAGKQRARILMQRKSVLAAGLKQITEEIEKKEAFVNGKAHYRVLAMRRAYAGVELVIGPYTLDLEDEYDRMKFCVEGGRISFSPLLSSDRP